MSTATVADPPILPGQRWRAYTGKHAGVALEVIRTNEHSVIVRVLPSPGAKSWNKGKSGAVWTLGRNLFGTLYRLVKESGGGSVHDAPLPPAAIRREMTIEDAVAQTAPEPTTIEVNGFHEYGDVRAVPYEKICSSCGKANVAADNFYHSSASKDGYHPWCKVCQNENRKKNYLAKKDARPEGDRIANLRTAIGTDAVKAAVRAGVVRKVEALNAEQKAEIIALWQSKTNPQEIQKAYGLNGAMYRMVLDEYRAEGLRLASSASTETRTEPTLDIKSFADALDAQEGTPGTPSQPAKSFTVTYTVLRPVEVTEVVEARYMTEAINTVGARDGVQEIVSVVLNKSEGK